MTDKMYRYETRSYSIVIDADMDIYGSSGPKLILKEFFITAKTPKGCWIGYFKGSKDFWVSDTSRKRKAHRTKEEALAAYKIRKTAYVKHATARLARAKAELKLSEKVLFND